MFYINICDFFIKINNKYDFVQNQCSGYIVDTPQKIDFEVSISDELIKEEFDRSELKNPPLGYCESVCIYREICKQALIFGAFLFHSAVVDVDGESYAFAAKSGTGKSTHINLWLDYFGDRAVVVNGDKPLMKFEGDTLYAYGTPWCGKERLQQNMKSPLKALCFLQRGEQNKITKIDEKTVVNLLFQQTILPTEPDKVALLFSLLGKMVKNVPCYLLECNISKEAVEVAYNGMK